MKIIKELKAGMKRSSRVNVKFLLINKKVLARRCVLCNKVINTRGRFNRSGLCGICSQEMRTGSLVIIAEKIKRLK